MKSPKMPVTLDPFYPVVPDAAWVSRVVERGARLVQLRLKDASSDEIARQIDAAQVACQAAGAQLIVNDHWQAAISAGATCVHLGQEDLDDADASALRAAGVALGLSTHDRAERARALALAPHHIALGPIYTTTLKQMKWRPQGLDRLRTWVDEAPCPVVAIGGITLERADDVWACGVASIAVVTDVVFHDTPDKRLDAWLAWAAARRAEPVRTGAAVAAHQRTDARPPA
ncbi:MAG: thiamine phosphate synthase [Pseudomonadota bacterium]